MEKYDFMFSSSNSILYPPEKLSSLMRIPSLITPKLMNLTFLGVVSTKTFLLFLVYSLLLQFLLGYPPLKYPQ